MNLRDEFMKSMIAMNQYQAARDLRAIRNSQICGICKQSTVVTDIRPDGPDSGTVGWKCTNCGKIDGPRE